MDTEIDTKMDSENNTKRMAEIARKFGVSREEFDEITMKLAIDYRNKGSATYSNAITELFPNVDKITRIKIHAFGCLRVADERYKYLQRKINGH